MCMVLLLQADMCTYIHMYVHVRTYVIEVGLFVKCQWAIYLITNYDMEFRNKIHSSMYGIDSETQFFLTVEVTFLWRFGGKLL